MKATIQFADKKKFLNLLHAMFAVHDRFTHDEDAINFHRENGSTFHIDFSAGEVSFGPEGTSPDSTSQSGRFWDGNIAIGEMDTLLARFIHNQDDELRRFQWFVRPSTRRKRKRV